MNEKIDVLDFIPKTVFVGKNQKISDLNIKFDDLYIYLSYRTNIVNKGEITGVKEHSLTIPRFVSRNKETFEVLGLLQAEMGKTQNGCLNFCNHEYNLVNLVMNWFENELEINSGAWKWYVKVNINEPEDEEYKKKIEEKVISYWLRKTKVNIEQRYPKAVSYVKNTQNKILSFYGYGTLIIEQKKNLLSQIIKQFVKSITYERILVSREEDIRGFMRGIIAGESNVEIFTPDKRYRVYITAKDDFERKVYQKCLESLGIKSKQCNYALIISKKTNHIKLLKQKLLCLSHKKYAKFLRIFPLYDAFPEYKNWKAEQNKPHNKIPQETVDEIIRIYHQNQKQACWKIAEQVGVSSIKVNRVLREHGLGKRMMKTPEDKRKNIAEFAKENPEMTQKQIAERFKVHESVVRRAIRKYS